MSDQPFSYKAGAAAAKVSDAQVQDLSAIKKVKIFPPIGIARLGNSDEYFIGPDVPGLDITLDQEIQVVDETGALQKKLQHLEFRDKSGKLKKQAVQFHVYGFDCDGNVVVELNNKNTKNITWTVSLANKKAGWKEFKGKHYEGDPPLRNATWGSDEAARAKLEITPPPQFVSTTDPDPRPKEFKGKIYEKDEEVSLGKIRVDAEGQLIVTGGSGASGSVLNIPITNFANNDSWWDDTSDGPVSVEVTLLDGKTKISSQNPAWVIVAPPKFAPGVRPIVTLYDRIQDTLGINDPGVLFWRDIFPTLAATADTAFLNELGWDGHRPGSRGDFRSSQLVARLSNNSDETKADRQAVFKRLRPPNDADPNYAKLRYMPALSGDAGDSTDLKPNTWMALTKSTYDKFELWADGSFETGIPERQYTKLEQIPLPAQPAALTKAALEWCIGGPFYPGIEMTFIAYDPNTFDLEEPFAINPALQAGDVTKYMALPWVADFYECNTHWWPTQRPDRVLTNLENEKDPFSQWDRGLSGIPGATETHHLENTFAKHWSEFGLVRNLGSSDRPLLVERERTFSYYSTMKNRDYFYYLMNIDEHPDFIPFAAKLAEDFLAKARARQLDKDILKDHPEYQPFAYSPEALNTWLDCLYKNNAKVAASEIAEMSDPSQKNWTREGYTQRLLQMAPFNQTDGMWLRGISGNGPIDEVHSLLFNILSDERGNGNVELNHATLYTELLHSLGFTVPDVYSREYSTDARFFDAAFDMPAMELALSQFSHKYFPEILGMTLNLEWNVGLTAPTVVRMRSFTPPINPQFYTMHIGIDNAASGHGWQAKRAVELYLDNLATNSDAEAVQRHWKRIFDGYVCFDSTGRDLDDDINTLKQHDADPTALYRHSMIAMIQSKAQYASQNHGNAQLGGMSLNALFARPELLLDQLAESSRFVSKGNPEGSSIFQKFAYSGPMYKVFTEDEIQLWKEWIKSLANPDIPPVDPTAKTPAENMAAFILQNQTDGSQEVSHKAFSLASNGVTQTVDKWFANPAGFMQALVDNGYVVRFKPNQGNLWSYVNKEDSGMGDIFATQLANTNKTGKQILTEWVAEGCKQPGATLRQNMLFQRIGPLLRRGSQSLQTGQIVHYLH